jgi:organic radical activating enzyme
MSGTLEEYGLSNLTFADNSEQNLNKVKKMLNSTGCGFCLAKFRQVTLHLGTGMTHSCHHPSPHKIELAEIKNNPAALFNTKILKSARKQMLNGERPDECDYCWRVEDNDGVSDRFYKSLEPWALPDHDSITQLTGDEDIYPKYLEVSFNNACNLQCVYCGPEFSSKWVEELKKYGPLKVLEGTKDEKWVQGYQDLDTLNYKNREFNPYVDAFWKWFPEASKHLKHYRITGGEPLMSKETFKSMDWIIENPNQDLEFSVNSNLSVPEQLWESFIERLKIIADNKLVKKFTVYTSVEGWGERAEYARTGLNFDLFKKRVEFLAAMDNVRVVVMAAFNMFSITSFDKVLDWIYKLKLEHNPCTFAATLEDRTGFNIAPAKNYLDRKKLNPSHSVTVGIDIPYLRHPTMLDIHFCTHQLLEDYLFKCVEYMAARTKNDSWTYPGGFEQYEVEKMKRIVTHRMYYNEKNKPERDSGEDIKRNRAEFYEFVNEMDNRRNTNFLKTFPEMTEFYEECKRCNEVYYNNAK